MRDADATAARLLAEHGLASVAGGRHAAWGTENRIVPLGGAYLELMTVFDRRIAVSTPLGRFVCERIAHGDSPIGWMVAGGGFDERVAALGLEALPFSRERPDGSTVSWRLAGLDHMLAEPPLPGLIAWYDPEAFPGATPADHRGITPRGFAWLELAGHPGRLNDWLGGAKLPLRVIGDAPPELRAAAIALEGGGEIVLR